MATAPNSNINIPYSEFLNATTGRPNQEWLLWLMNPSFISINIGSALPVTSGGTGLSAIPTSGQLLIGNGTGYTLNPLTPGAGIGITNGAGAITVANTGVLSWSGGSTGLTPATATTGAVTLAGTLGAGYGGTGLSTYAVGDLLYASGATALSRLADVATGSALISGGVTTAPSWGKIGLTTHVSGTLPIANGGTNGTATATAGAIAYGTGSAYAFTAAGTLGQVLTSAGAGTPTWATPTTGTVTAVSVVSANGLAGTVATATTTPAITLSTTITGLLKGNGTAISAATSGTDYAPATSGTSILYGNGSGGFSNVTIGTGVAFAGGTLSATGSGGTVTSVTGTAPVVSSGGTTPAISMAAATTSVNGYLTSTDWTTFNSKQAALVSGTNIKTVNGTTLLGSGDLGTITYAYGGTGQTAVTTGDLLYGSASNVWSKLGIGTTGQILRVVSGAPAWGTDYAGTVTSVAALTLGTTGTDLSSTVATSTTTPVITLNVPTASATNRGALSAADWTTFNNKGSGSVTSVAQSFTGGLISVAGSPITTSGTLALTVAGTSGGVPYFSSASTWATSAALTASALVLGGGAGAAPATTTTGTGVVTALGVNTGTAGAFVVNGGALGTPSSGTVTNLTGTASINTNGAHNGTVGATTPAAGSFTQLGASAQITSTIGNNGTLFSATTATTGYQYAIVQNTSGSLVWGIEGSGAGNLIVGDTAYDAFVRGKTGIAFSANDGAAMQMRLSSTGLAVTGTLSSTGLLSTSAASASIKPASTTNPILITASDTNPTYGMVSLNNSATATGVVGIWGGADSDLRYAVPTGGTHLTRVNNSTVTTTSSTGLAVTGTAIASTSIGVGNTTPSGGGAGIAFPATQSASTDANTLDDYEEGTFTPTMSSGTGGPVVLSTAVGQYTKIGNIVNFRLRVTVSNANVAGGAIAITSLPFTCSSSIAQRTRVISADISNVTGSTVDTIGGSFIGNGGSSINVLTTTGANVVLTNTSSMDFNGTYFTS